MAVKLEHLYEEIKPQYSVKLCTESCYGKIIEWAHIVEDFDFIRLLHGDELVFNTGLQYKSTRWIKKYIKELNEAGAGGLVIALREGMAFPQEVLDYANSLRFPLFSAHWDTPFIDIMRLFATILLRNEQRDINLTAALKNAIYYPENEESYLNHLERCGFYRNMPYTMVILSCRTYAGDNGNPRLKQLERNLQYSIPKGIVYEENGMVFLLAAGERMEDICREFKKLCQQDKNVYVGIGSRIYHLQDIHITFRHALAAYQLTKTAIQKNLLQYDELGVYKILTGLSEAGIGEEFVNENLGRLITYDRKNKTEYTSILKAYFKHECSIIQTAKALYCHKNTLTYKMNKIKEILGYDIHTNENRTKIMLSFYLQNMKM